MTEDKFGVYRLGDLKVYSKLEAIEMHAKTGIHPHWDFNEAILGCYDWTKEPSQSLTDLYRQRAQQLRDQYDYIILQYSGGADSQNVLDTFLDNNIMLDEIVTFVNYEATGETHNFLNAEAWEVAIPKGKSYTEKYPWLHHRILDWKDITLEYFSRPSSRYEWIYAVNMVITPFTVAKESLMMKVEDWANRVNAGQRVCMLYGSDKPRVLHINGKFLLRFIDMLGNCPDVNVISGQQQWHEELFYWTPDLPEIMIKQAHVIRRYLSGPDVAQKQFVSRDKSDLAYVEKDGVKWWLSNHGVHTLLYPKWDINTFSVGKPSSCIVSPRDTWFFDIEDSHVAKSNWRTGFDKLKTSVPEYWLNDPNDLSAGFKACWSRDYYLE